MAVTAPDASASCGARQFSISAPDDVLADLKRRIEITRWPDCIPDAGWEYGAALPYMQELAAYWRDEFDWRAQERRLNAYANMLLPIDGGDLHFIRIESGLANATPILLLHGWPSTFIQMLDLGALLSDPAGPGPTFDVVIASLPGYGYSKLAGEAGWGCRRMAAALFRLMHDVLGYERFVIRSGDIGAAVADWICFDHPEAIIGNHLTGMLEPDRSVPPANATTAEQTFLAQSNQMWLTEMSYARQHASRPQTLAYGLNDSPIGLAAWIVEKFRIWSDCGGEIERRFSKDDLLTNLTIYWTTGTINSSIRVYYELVREARRTGPIVAPTGMLVNKRDMFPAPPREWASRSYNIVHWSETDCGGHFLEWEEPGLVAQDIRAFVRQLV